MTWTSECSCHESSRPIWVLYEIFDHGQGEALFGIVVVTLFEFGIPAVVIGWILQLLIGIIVKKTITNGGAN
jgi:hypothetical protein